MLVVPFVYTGRAAIEHTGDAIGVRNLRSAPAYIEARTCISRIREKLRVANVDNVDPVAEP